MRWKDASKQEKIKKMIVQNRFNRPIICPPVIKAESIESFIARGGKIKRISNDNEGVEMSDHVTPVNKMTAKEAAEMVINNPACSIKEIMAVIPEYKAPLPRRSWIAKFKSIINYPQFADLK